MDLKLESEYFRNEFEVGIYEFYPLKKEVCMGCIHSDEFMFDVLVDFFSEAGKDVFMKRNEIPVKVCFYGKTDEYVEYFSFFFSINWTEIMSFSVPVEQNEEKLKESVMPVFRNFWETNFEKIMEVRKINRKSVEKLSKKNTAAAAKLIWFYYAKVEQKPEEEYFWLKKWASRSSVGRKRLLEYYRQHHEYSKAEKLSWVSQGENKRDNF